jgi:hypothetical protein
VFANSNSVAVVPNDIGPRVVGTDARGWWGGARDLSWYVCPITFTPSLVGDICEIEVTASFTGTGSGPLYLAGNTTIGGVPVDVLDSEPFMAVARYRDAPVLVGGIANPDWADSKSFNEDRVQSSTGTGEEVISVTRVWACDGTDISSSLSPGHDDRPIDLRAPLCETGNACFVAIDGSAATNQNGAGELSSPPNFLYSAGAFDLREETATCPGAGCTKVADAGVGSALGSTIILAAWDFDAGDPTDLELIDDNIASVAVLDEDDACGSGGTTDPALGGAAGFPGAFGLCAATGEAGRPVDSYVIQIAEVGDLLGNKLGDGTMDLAIADEFITEVVTVPGGLPTGIVVSGQFGVDRTAPVIDDELPPDATVGGSVTAPLFVWNPDTTFPPGDGTGPFETVMWEAIDPALDSGDPGSGVEDASCGAACADENGDLRKIDLLISDAPNAIDDGAGLGNVILADNNGLAANMFQSDICGQLNAGVCDDTNDGTYAVSLRATDKALRVNNRGTFSYSFIIDPVPPVIGFGGITGLNASNAATVEFVLDASVTDRNGDGTAVTSAIVQVTVNNAGLGAACPGNLVTAVATGVVPAGGNDDASGNTVIADVTSAVQTGGGDFSQLFTASNLGAGAYTYCFELTADDGAKTKNGVDDGFDIAADASKDFTWQ